MNLESLDRHSLPLAGGKAANLGELIQAGFPVPPGFCVSTASYAAAAEATGLPAVLDVAENLTDLAEQARERLLGATLDPELVERIKAAYAALSPDSTPARVAVRSSATAEDLPDASFAGQQDTYLDIVGEDAVLDAVRRCWASLWTERAVAYRASNGIPQEDVRLAVVVQRMVPAATAGVLFTANPLTGQRRQAVIDAAPGLGEAVVSGSVNPDHFVVDTAAERVVERRPAAISMLSDGQILELARAGAAVEAHYQAPQDIEWAYDAEGILWLLQARPITTLFPLPEGARASSDHLDVYFSVNVAQGVLGPFTPAGIESFKRIGSGMGQQFGFQIDPEQGPGIAVEAASRLFFQVTPMIRRQLGRKVFLGVLSIMEAQSGQVIRGLLDDPRLSLLPGPSRPRLARHVLTALMNSRAPLRMAEALVRPEAARDRAFRSVERFVASQAGGPASPDDALSRATRLLERAAPVVLRVFPVGLAGLVSYNLARRILRSSGVNDDDALLVTRGLPHNPTTEMNLALWAIAARLRQDPEIANLFETMAATELAAQYLAGSLPPAIQEPVQSFLQRYGFRGLAEIDLGAPRWSDDPIHIFGVLSNYLRLEDPQLEPDIQFRRSVAEAESTIDRLVEATRASGRTGPAKAHLVRLLLTRTRDLAGIRELPKVTFVHGLSRARELLLDIGGHLVQHGQIDRPDDVMFLRFAEIRRALSGERFDEIVAQRRDQHSREQRRRRVPRILLSDGRVMYGNEGISADGTALVGTPASPGAYTGRARVILDPAGARIEPGEVLVAPSTDPAWTPLFMTAGALVMEMGGMMSHGSVVAREYGIPAVVGAFGAATAIQTGQLVTVDGSRGVVVLGEVPTS